MLNKNLREYDAKIILNQKYHDGIIEFLTEHKDEMNGKYVTKFNNYNGFMVGVTPNDFCTVRPDDVVGRVSDFNLTDLTCKVKVDEDQSEKWSPVIDKLKAPFRLDARMLINKDHPDECKFICFDLVGGTNEEN
jgi:hypothetical protein